MTGNGLAIDVAAEEPVVCFRRFVDARPSLAFAVWTEPEHLRHWWGPRGFVLVVCESDLRVGGRYRYVQRLDEWLTTIEQQPDGSS